VRFNLVLSAPDQEKANQLRNLFLSLRNRLRKTVIERIDFIFLIGYTEHCEKGRRSLMLTFSSNDKSFVGESFGMCLEDLYLILETVCNYGGRFVSLEKALSEEQETLIRNLSLRVVDSELRFGLSIVESGRTYLYQVCAMTRPELEAILKTHIMHAEKVLAGLGLSLGMPIPPEIQVRLPKA